MYVEKKKIKGKTYNYLKLSMRIRDKVRTKTIAYLGKEPMTKKEIEKKILEIPKNKIESAKKSLKKEMEENFENINKNFLTEKQLEKLEGIKKSFNKKLKISDKKLVEDMFKDFKTDYIYNTNSIEGNTLTLEETDLLLNENKTPEGKDLREIYDHLNEKEVFDYLLRKKPKINLNLMIEIHSRLLKNIDKRIGLRKHNVRVFGASFEATDAKYVYTDMNLLLKWYNKEKKILHPLILAAIFHEKFERIHPFYDGNGRTGRMLMNLILLSVDFPPLIIKDAVRLEYFRVLNSGHKADLTKTESEHYKPIVQFCYQQLIAAYEKIFSKWG